jgi:hypothetical protein
VYALGSWRWNRQVAGELWGLVQAIDADYATEAQREGHAGARSQDFKAR